MKLKLLLLSILLFGCTHVQQVISYSIEDGEISNIDDISDAYFISAESYTLKKARQEIGKHLENIITRNDYEHYFVLLEGEATSLFKQYAVIRIKFFKSENDYSKFKENYNPFE